MGRAGGRYKDGKLVEHTTSDHPLGNMARAADEAARPTRQVAVPEAAKATDQAKAPAQIKNKKERNES